MFHKKYCLLTINIVLIVFSTSAQINNCTLQKNVLVEDFTFYSDKEYTSLDNILGGQIETSYIKNSKGASEGVNVTDGHCLVVTNGAEGGWWNKNPIRYGNTGNSGASEYGGFPAKDGFLVVNCDVHKGDMFTYILPQGSICSDSYYSFTADITNMNIAEPPKVRVPINVSFIVLGLPDEVELMNVNTGNIAETNKWHNCGGTFFSKGYKKFKLIIRNNYEAAQGETVVSGNDVGIDNIIFSQCMPEAKMFSDDADINGEVNICEPITEVYFNDSELKSFFSKPYYLLQTSKDGTNWNNYESATTSSRISINLINQLNKTPYLYRVWAGGSIEAVSSSAQSGTPGECEMLTTVSKTMTITRSCEYTKSEAPEVDNFEECAGETAGGKLNLTTLVKAHKEKLTWYKAASGDEKLESVTVDISQPGVYHYYVTNTEPGYSKIESDRVEVTVTIKGHIQYSLDKTLISECMQDEHERSFNIQNPVPSDATFEWYNGTTLLGSGLKYTLENKEGSGTITIKATDASGNFCATPYKKVQYSLSSPVSAELKAAPLAVYIGKTEVTVTASNVEGAGKYTLYKDDNEVLSGTSQEGKDIIFKDKDFTTEGMLAYKLSIVNGLCSFDTYTAVNVLKDSSEPEPFTPDCPHPIEPMVFVTPNADGLNDLWQVKHIECYSYYSVEIYDRYHKCLLLVKDSYNPFSWDGTYNGHKLPNGDYWYIITVQEGDIRKQRSGHFILKK